MNFTKKAISELPHAAPGKRDTYSHDKIPGFQIRVTDRGVKSFYIRRMINGKQERIKLGVFGEMTVEQAIKAAERVNGNVSQGENLAAVRRSLKAEPTFSDVFADFIKARRNRSGKALSDRTKSDYEECVRLHLSPISKLKMSEITPERLKRLKISSDAQNNRAKAIISSVFGWAYEEGISTAPNPAIGIKQRVIASRERFLTSSEIPRFLESVSQNRLRDFWLMLLITGQRKGNVQAMRWADVDLDEALWVIPSEKTKNGEIMRVPLVPLAVEVLRERLEARTADCAWVFEGPGSTGHLVTPRKAWLQLLEDAGIEDLRIHDLRRSLGSWLARGGESLLMIGRALGHKSPQSTAIYARLNVDPVRTAVEDAVTEIMSRKKQPSP